VPARDWLGNQKRAADGTPLYKGEPDRTAEAAGGLIGLAIIVALALAAAAAWLFAKAVGWWWPRLSTSFRRDIADRRLSWTTLAWLSPVILLVVWVGASGLRGGGATPSFGSPLSESGSGIGTVGETPVYATPMLRTATASPEFAPRATRVLSAGQTARLTGANLSIVIPANDCGGYVFALRIANESAADVMVRYQFSSEVWGGEAVQAGCYPGTASTGTDTVPAGKTLDIGFRDLGPGPTVMAVGVGPETVEWNLVHELVPTSSASALGAADSATLAGVEMGIVGQSANNCGGYAFGLRIENQTDAEVIVRYSFQGEVWGGGEVSPDCYPQTATDGSRDVAAGTTTVVGFRDLGSAATVLTVAVGTTDPVFWILAH